MKSTLQREIMKTTVQCINMKAYQQCGIMKTGAQHAKEIPNMNVLILDLLMFQDLFLFCKILDFGSLVISSASFKLRWKTLNKISKGIDVVGSSENKHF